MFSKFPTFLPFIAFEKYTTRQMRSTGGLFIKVMYMSLTAKVCVADAPQVSRFCGWRLMQHPTRIWDAFCHYSQSTRLPLGWKLS